MSFALFVLFAGSLVAQRLQDEGMGQLLGATVYPQDRVLGLLYIPENASRASEQIFELARRFWNQVNTGSLADELLSTEGRPQLREQLAPFSKNAPPLYRQSLREPQAQKEKTGEDSPPLDFLRLDLVRLAQPVIESDYARARFRLEVDDNSAFIRGDMYFLAENGVWKIDALDWGSREARAMGPIQVFGRKQELR